MHMKTCIQSFAGNFVLSCQNLEATQIHLSRWMDRHTVYIIEWILCYDEKEQVAKLQKAMEEA